MPITTVGVGAAVTPTVVKTYISHYTNRKPRRQKPTAHISYDEGLHLIRSFLDYASHKTVEDLQAFTAQWVPSPTWVRTENVRIPTEHVARSAEIVISQLGSSGVEQVGGAQWWQWRPAGRDLKAEWIEMRAHYNESARQGEKSRRIMLYVHGGAYFFGSVDEHRYQMQRHARKLKARVFAPRYRLAPQFPFPCGLHDCLAAYLYLLTMHAPAEIILAGDSAGGGMVVSLLCMLRDQALPLPAGAVLISPWVDLTHSFPSLAGDNELDYIPAHGFMHKPSASWPPPNNDEAIALSNATQPNGNFAGSDANSLKLPSRQPTMGFSEQPLAEIPAAADGTDTTLKQTTSVKPSGNLEPDQQLHLSVELDGKRVTLTDQIQMYTTNQLLAHPLVSPVLQPSLGGLPPLLILTGGGEVLRDEQIYLAHKAAHPTKYPLGKSYRELYDPGDVLLRKYKPTNVQLQVWEDLCHVAPTLSFTRPAKFMYRSISQFGAWALARAQKRAIEIVDDDNISQISSRSSSDTEDDDSSDALANQKLDLEKITGSVGRAGDALPSFSGNMIRQRVDCHGRIYPLPEPSSLPALTLSPDDVGRVKPGPVRKWIDAKTKWDTKYASTRRRIQQQRLDDITTGRRKGFAKGEKPPPSALAGRRTEQEIEPGKQRKSYWLALWSGWGSKHDEATMKREEETVAAEKDEKDKPDETNEQDPEVTAVATPMATEDAAEVADRTRSPSSGRGRSSSNRRASGSKAPSRRRRTISVVDAGQTGDQHASVPLPPIVTSQPPFDPSMSSQSTAIASAPAPAISASTPSLPSERDGDTPDTHLSAGFIPKFKIANHLRNESLANSDAASTISGTSRIIPDDASTRAVFSVAGVTKAHPTGDKQTPSSPLRPGSPLAYRSDDEEAPTPTQPGGGADTPRSQQSLERLRSHQQDESMGMLPVRSPSTTAVMKVEGIANIVDSEPQEPEYPRDDTGAAVDDVKGKGREKAKEEEWEKEREAAQGDQTGDESAAVAGTDVVAERPKMYDRSDTQYQTASEG